MYSFDINANVGVEEIISAIMHEDFYTPSVVTELNVTLEPKLRFSVTSVREQLLDSRNPTNSGRFGGDEEFGRHVKLRRDRIQARRPAKCKERSRHERHEQLRVVKPKEHLWSEKNENPRRWSPEEGQFDLMDLDRSPPRRQVRNEKTVDSMEELESRNCRLSGGKEQESRTVIPGRNSISEESIDMDQESKHDSARRRSTRESGFELCNQIDGSIGTPNSCESQPPRSRLSLRERTITTKDSWSESRNRLRETLTQRVIELRKANRKTSRPSHDSMSVEYEKRSKDDNMTLDEIGSLKAASEVQMTYKSRPEWLIE